jgi:DNA transformation protein and related proteins
MTTSNDTANYCCDLLSTVGPCVAKRMFGGYGISTDGLTIAIIADLGAGEKLWLKGDDSTRSQYEAAGCVIFTYDMKGVPKSMNYFSAPDAAMDSADAMRPWAALALACAVRANASKRKPRPVNSTKAVQQSTGQTTTAKATKLSPAVLQRAQEVAKKLALSKNLPSPIATKAPTKMLTSAPSQTRSKAPARPRAPTR